MSNSVLGSVFNSIRIKFLAIIVIFVAALMLTVIGFINNTVGDIVLEQGLEKGLAVARGVATSSDDPLLTNDDLTLFTVIKGITENKGIIYGFIVGRDNKIKAHSNVTESGGDYKTKPKSKTLRHGKDYTIIHFNDPNLGFVYEITVPITSLRLRESIGSVHIGITRKVVDEAVNRVNLFIKYLLISGLLVGSVGAILITGVIVKPVHELVKSAHELGNGNLNYRINVTRKDELGTLMKAFNEMADGLKQKQHIQESFGRYVSSDLVEMIVKNKETWFKGKKTDVTILFADIRDFTAYSEKRDPESIINHLNEYFTIMTDIIHKNHGYVDKFIGDEIMAVFGSPVEYENHAFLASRAACEMLEKLRSFNIDRQEADQIQIGIGLNTGEVVAGNLGSIHKMEYAVIGDNVNTASRLCNTAKKDEIIISRKTFDGISAFNFETHLREPVTVKGRSEPIEIYSLVAHRGPQRKTDAEHAVLLTGK
jgi:adenylate cyclase